MNFSFKKVSCAKFIFIINFIAIDFIQLQVQAGEESTKDHVVVGEFAQKDYPITCKLPFIDGYLSSTQKKQLNTPKKLTADDISIGFREYPIPSLLQTTKPLTKKERELAVENENKEEALPTKAFFRKCFLGRKKSIYLTRINCDGEDHFVDLEEIAFSTVAFTTIHKTSKLFKGSPDHYKYRVDFNVPKSRKSKISDLKGVDLMRCLKKLQRSEITNIFGKPEMDKQAYPAYSELEKVISDASNMFYASLRHGALHKFDGFDQYQPINFKNKFFLNKQCETLVDAINRSTRFDPPLSAGEEDTRKFINVSRHGGENDRRKWETNFGFTNEIQIMPGLLREHLTKDLHCKTFDVAEAKELNALYKMKNAKSKSKKTKQQ